jgi:HTH-type transcriptional regulator, competence development regulator
MELDLKRLGESIRFRREGRGWSLAELAQKSGVSKAYISDLENGKGGRPNIQYLFMLTVSLGTTIDALINSTNPAQQQDADESEKHVPLPLGLAEFAQAQGLTADEVQMLAKLNFRGSRPKDADAWRAIYEVIRLASK